MKIYDRPIELIIDIPPVTAKSKSPGDLKKQLAAAGIPVDWVGDKKAKLPPRKSKPGSKGLMTDIDMQSKVYAKTKLKDSQINPWDVAHKSSKALGNRFVEPDQLHEFIIDKNTDLPYKKGRKDITAKGTSDDGYDPDWWPHKNIIWHLGDKFSQLKSARESVQDIDYVVRIGHIDTGYNLTHQIIPDSIRKNKLQRNFVEDEDPNDAHDRLTDGMGRMPNHGTGTLGILAGGKIKLNTDEGVFDDYLGGAWFADVVCCRISPSVILIKTSAFAEAVKYLTSLHVAGTPVHVISMSMGGAPAKAWADAVNAAYEAGITIVTASGNNFNGLPTQHVIFPARFNRVIAACGVTYDWKPYWTSKLGEMRGCFGPKRHMDKALAAFTPNTPWAAGNDKRIMFSGAGTSSATPQIAAAAALYYKKYNQQLNAIEGWKRVEAIRYALYKSASPDGNPRGSYQESFGNGILQAMKALNIPVNSNLPMTDKDQVPWFPILSTIFKARPGKEPSAQLTMFNTELAQLVYNYPGLAEIINNDERDYSKISAAKWKKFTDAVIEHPGASTTLKNFLMASHKK